MACLLLFFNSGCNQDMDNDSENAGPWPDYAVAADALTNNLMNAGYILGNANNSFSFRKRDKAVYKIDERRAIHQRYMMDTGQSAAG